AVPAVDMPAGSLVVGRDLVVRTAFDSGDADSIDIGDGDTADEYTATAIDGQAAARTALTITGKKYAEADTIDVTWTGAGTPASEGEAKLTVEYIIEGRALENQPVR